MKYEVILFDADDTLFDYSLAEAHALKSVFLEHQIELMQSHVEQYRLVNQQLLSCGHRTAIITNGIKQTQHSRIGRSSLANSFEHIIVSEETGYSKPHTGIFDYAFNKLNITDKSKVLMVGDSLTSDIQGGINYGIDTCWFNPKNKTNVSAINPIYEIQRLVDLLRII